MDSVLRVQGRIGPRTLLITTAALPLTGWTVHAVALHRRLAATRKDPLTGLMRRDAYTARARRLLARHGDDTAVVIVDQDHFKAVNDDFGHPAGDAVLAATAARLNAWAGPRAAVGRLGGDEFAVVLELPAARLEQRLAATGSGRGSRPRAGSRRRPRRQRTADAALYDGKHSGRAAVASPAHTTVPSINGRRAGRPGTAVWGQAA
jgi:GGDEF domain-containing protein